jgi:hypothetical protein
MGYISSATTEYIDLHISEYGRKFLLQGSLADQITQFALGDIDKDYRNSDNLASGFVPDVTGSHENCIFGVNDGYTVGDKITYIEGASDLLTQRAQMMFGYKESGNYTWTNHAKVNVFLHDYLAMFKVLALYNANHHSFGGLNMSIFTDFFNAIFDTAGQPWSLNMKEMFETLEEQGKDANLNIVHKIFKKEGGALIPTPVKLTLVGNNSQLLFKKFFGAIYMTGANAAVIGEGPTLGLPPNQLKFPSPFSMTNSIYEGLGGTAPGAGPLGIDISGAVDFGYTYGSVLNPTSDPSTTYPQYGFNQGEGGFYNIFHSQNTSLNNTLFSATNLDTIIPTARYILEGNIETNAYYILQTNQINTTPLTSTLFSSQSGNLDGMSATESTGAWETFGMFVAGTVEYGVNPGITNFASTLQPNYNPVNEQLEPKMGVTTLLLEIEKFFTALESEFINYISVSGTGINKIYTVPFTFQAADASTTNTKTGTLDVNFILSFPALYENFTRDTNPIIYRALDSSQTEARFYGGAYTTLSQYTTDPTHFETSGPSPHKTFIEFKSV